MIPTRRQIPWWFMALRMKNHFGIREYSWLPAPLEEFISFWSNVQWIKAVFQTFWCEAFVEQILVHSHEFSIYFILLKVKVDTTHVDHKVWKWYSRLQSQSLVFLRKKLQSVEKPLNDNGPLRETNKAIKWEVLFV